MAEQLIAGHEQLYYSWFYRNFADNKDAITPAAQSRYVAAYSRPGSTHAGFELYRQLDHSAADEDALFVKVGSLTIPVLGVGGGGQNGLGSAVADGLHRLAEHATSAIVPHAGHWVTEENPTFVLDLLLGFLT